MLLNKTAPTVVRLCVLYGFTLAGTFVGELVIEWIGIWGKKDFLGIVTIVGMIATPQVVILSSIRTSVRMLIALGMYCFSSMVIWSTLYGYTYSSTAALVYLGLYLFGIPIALVIDILLRRYNKQVKENTSHKHGRVTYDGRTTYNFYTETNLPFLALISLSFAVFIPFNFMFLTGLVVARWKTLPSQTGKFLLMLFAIILLIVPYTIITVFFDDY